MKTCPKCGRNIFENETECGNCGTANGRTPEQALAESERRYGVLAGAAVCYLILCFLVAVGCLLKVFTLLTDLNRPGVLATIGIFLSFGAASLISGFLVYRLSKLAVDAANDVRLLVARVTVRHEKTSDETRLFANIANDLATKGQSTASQ